jgi:hypothetical protein
MPLGLLQQSSCSCPCSGFSPSGPSHYGGTAPSFHNRSSIPGVGKGVVITFATPTATAAKTSAVTANTLDKVTASEFPAGDTVTAQECDANVTSANLANNCDNGTQISGTAGTNGKVTFSPTGVTILVGSTYSDGAGGTCPAGGSCDIVVDDSTTGAYVAIPVGLAS